MFWTTGNLNQNAQKNIIDTLINTDDNKQIDIVEYTGEDIENILTKWSDEKLKSTVLLFTYNSTSQDRLEGYDPKILNKMYTLKKDGKDISLAGKALLTVIKVNNPKNVKTKFSDEDLKELKFNIKKLASNFIKDKTIIGAFRVIINDKYEVYDIDQNKKNKDLFDTRVLKPLKNL